MAGASPWSHGGTAWLNTLPGPQAYGVENGHVSLSSDAPGMSYATWTSPISGTIQVTGAFGHTPTWDAYGGGNNWCWRWIYLNSVTQWEKWDGYAVDAFNLTLSVNVGDTLTFQVGSQGPYCGNTQTDVHIVAVPEVGWMAVGPLAFGLFLMVPRRAKRLGSSARL